MADDKTTDNKALEVIQDWQREDSDSGVTMSLYQQVADHFMQRESSITVQRTPGEDKSLPIIDPTGRIAFQKMCAGLSAVMFPTGQYFCRLAPETSGDHNARAISYLNLATEIFHTEIFKPSCNFILEINETIMSWAGFGTGCVYSEWNNDLLTLNFKDWDVSNFRFGLDARGFPNRCLIRWQYTAQQAVELFGENAGPQVIEASKDTKRSQEKFWFLWRIRPRRDRNFQYSDRQNYAYEKICVNEKEKCIVEEGGYREFPYHIARWLTTSAEKWGYGQAVYGLSADKELQQQKRSLMLCADLANNPPRQTLSSFEGPPKVYPGANNIVNELNSIAALDRNLQGSFPITKDTLEMTKQDLRNIFFDKVFAPLDELTGDRRTRLEIAERIKAGYQQLVLPVTRFYNECLTPLVERCVLLLLRNYRIPPPPPELRGFKVEYLGRLALALKEQHADALQRYVEFAALMEQVAPNFTTDTINIDRAGRNMATTFGVSESDLNTPDEREAIRAKRQQQLEQQQAMMAAQAASQAIKDTSKTPEDGSPAQQMLQGVA
jgi:hypothetical protein